MFIITKDLLQMFTETDVTFIAKPQHSQRDNVDTKLRNNSKGLWPWVQGSGFKCRLCHLPAVWLWAAVSRR